MALAVPRERDGSFEPQLIGKHERRFTGFDEKVVRGIRERIRKSHYKRVMPLIAKVSLRTIGHDFLYPRDWESD